MHHDQFTRYMHRAGRIAAGSDGGADYAAGYRLGLRRHHHGERFQLPLPTEQLGDTGRFGQQAVGFCDGLAGRAPALPGETSPVHFEVARRKKAAWVAAAQRADMKLVPWIIQHLDAAVETPGGA